MEFFPLSFKLEETQEAMRNNLMEPEQGFTLKVCVREGFLFVGRARKKERLVE